MICSALMKRYRPWSPEQSYLLPPSPLEWLPEGHLAYFVLDTVRDLDLGDIERAIQAKDGRGERPYSPSMMVALLLYAYCVGVFSSRRIARATYEDVAFRVLAAGSQPHFTTINQFRLDHRQALAELFVQVLRLCRKAGLVKLGHVAIDGTKVEASASKHKAMSYKRMQEEEARLRSEIDALLARADDADRKEDELHGVGRAPDDLPHELQRREARLKKIREAKAALEQEAKEARAAELRERAAEQREKAANETVAPGERKRAKDRAARSEAKAEELAASDDEGDDDPSSPGSSGLPRHRMQCTVEGTPRPTSQRNFTDPDSRVMFKGKNVIQAFNAQAAVDSESQVILAVAVTNQPQDSEHFAPMLERVKSNCGEDPAVITADAGYFSQENVRICEERGIEPFIAVGKEGKSSDTPGPDTPAHRAKLRMATKLRTERGAELYAQRKAIVEPPFGQIKQARGFRRFSFRGTANVAAEWSFVCLTHNLLKLFRSSLRLQTA